MAEDESHGDERMLTCADIATRTQSSLWFVRSQVRSGRLRARRLGVGGRVLRITQADYQQWLAGDDARGGDAGGAS